MHTATIFPSIFTYIPTVYLQNHTGVYMQACNMPNHCLWDQPETDFRSQRQREPPSPKKVFRLESMWGQVLWYKHGTTEWFVLEGTFKYDLVPTPLLWAATSCSSVAKWSYAKAPVHREVRHHRYSLIYIFVGERQLHFWANSSSRFRQGHRVVPL